MIESIILLSLLMVILSYFLVSIKEKSYINVLTPTLLIFVPANYIFELIHIYYYGYSGSLYGYFFCYLTYALSFTLLALTYIKYPPYLIKLPFGTSNFRNFQRFLPHLFLLLSFLLYLPILIEFRELIFSPRDIYIHTRTGYGGMYFFSALLLYIAFILFLYKKGSKIERYGAFTLCVLLAFLHGSKGQVVTLILIAMLFYVYVHDYKIKFRSFLKYMTGTVVAIALLFYLTFSVDMANDFIKAISRYSDYTRNAIMVIDSDLEARFGELTLENTIYARVPRSIYPDKPKDFGTFYLAKKFFPAWFRADTGAPAFGIGTQYADFGVFSLYYIILAAIFEGVLLRIFVTRLKSYKSPSDFIMVLFFSGIGLIPVGIGYLLPEHFVMALTISFMMRVRLFSRPSADLRKNVL